MDVKDQYNHLINGESVPASNDEYLETINPATEEPIAEFANGTADDVDAAVRAARDAQPDWEGRVPSERGRIITRVGTLIRENADDLAQLESLDQGKPLSQAKNDVELAARFFEYYGGAGDKLEGRSIPHRNNQIDFTVREPYGVSGQITPWNFPLVPFSRGVAPALVAGNTVVAKPAPTTPISTLHLAELCHEAGVPDGTLNIVTGGTEPGAAITSHEDIDTISFTGSVRTGQAVMESAAKNITPVTLELGGKNPSIVMSDANLDSAEFWTSVGIFINAGQICSAADRAIVHESIYDEFVERVVDRAESFEMGPGTEDPGKGPHRYMGPLNHEEHMEKVLNYIDIGTNEGATLETGGDVIDREGYFVEPTVFSDVDTDMRIAHEEIFGPVLVVIPFSEEEEAIEIANDVSYGLAGAVFSRDIKRALSVAQEVDAGNVWVNEWFGEGVETPFGGYKESGIGRENGYEGLESYLQTKNISINLDRR